MNFCRARWLLNFSKPADFPLLLIEYFLDQDWQTLQAREHKATIYYSVSDLVWFSWDSLTQYMAEFQLYSAFVSYLKKKKR